MCGPAHRRRIKPARLHLRERLQVKGFVDLRRAAQDPKIVATRLADHGVLVVRTKISGLIRVSSGCFAVFKIALAGTGFVTRALFGLL